MEAMTLRKCVVMVVVISMTWLLIAPGVFAQDAIGPPGLGQVERILYGRVQEGALLSRLERVERDVYGQPRSDSAFLVRVERLVAMLTGGEGTVSLKMKLNAVEWAMFQEINEGPSIADRLGRLEQAMFGEAQSGAGLVDRLDNLLQLMWPGGRVYVAEKEVPARTLIRIELLTGLSSETSRAKDTVRYRVVDDVRVDDAIVIPAGAEGEGRVTSVEAAGRLGQDGVVQVDFGQVMAIDSSLVRVGLEERATERNQSLELAAGASIAGVVLLGPIGLAAGYFVQGRHHEVPVGTEFFIETTRDTTVQGLSLVPVTN